MFIYAHLLTPKSQATVCDRIVSRYNGIVTRCDRFPALDDNPRSAIID